MTASGFDFHFYILDIPGNVAGVCRCIDKAGGLDRYLLRTSDQELGSDVGSRLKAEIIAKRQMQKLQIAAQQDLLPFAASATTRSEAQ